MNRVFLLFLFNQQMHNY